MATNLPARVCSQRHLTRRSTCRTVAVKFQFHRAKTPSVKRLAMEATAASAGSPYIPTGNPMVDGIGAAAWAPRRDVTELDAHGHNKIQAMSNLPDFAVSAGRDPRGKPVVAGDGQVIGRILDMWIDVPEQMVRYLTVDLNPEGNGNTRLIPINFCKIQNRPRDCAFVV